MCEKKLKKAKEMFFSYSCSHFFMARDGVYDAYKQFNISEKKELEWLEEYKYDLWVQMSKASDYEIKSLFFRYEDAILTTKDLCGLKKMSEIALNRLNSDDSFTKLLLVERVLNVIEKLRGAVKENESVIPEAIEHSRELLNSIKENPILIKDYHLQTMMMEDEFEEKSILFRIDESLELCASLSSEVC